MGLMLGSEMIWRKMRSSGKQIVVITLAQSLMTFAVVSLAFSAIFYFMDIPVFLGLIFGGIALATAPAPALSIVSEYKTDGPVTRTLIPLAVIDDVLAICVFLLVMSFILPIDWSYNRRHHSLYYEKNQVRKSLCNHGVCRCACYSGYDRTCQPLPYACSSP